MYLTMASSVLSVLFNAWVVGLFVFEYDKDNLILDQTTRENLPAKATGGPDSRDDVFPRNDFNAD